MVVINNIADIEGTELKAITYTDNGERYKIVVSIREESDEAVTNNIKKVREENVENRI